MRRRQLRPCPLGPMAFEDLRARTASHLRSRLLAALQKPVICFSHVERTDSIGVTGRIFKELADLGIADVPLLDPSDATHVAGRVVSPEPVGFRQAVADALGDFTVVLQEDASDGRLVLCGSFAKDVFSCIPGLQDIVTEESVSCVPYPDLWFRHVDAVHQALDEALKDASDGEPVQFPDADTFAAILQQCWSMHMKEWWADLPDERLETICEQRKQW